MLSAIPKRLIPNGARPITIFLRAHTQRKNFLGGALSPLLLSKSSAGNRHYSSIQTGARMALFRGGNHIHPQRMATLGGSVHQRFKLNPINYHHRHSFLLMVPSPNLGAVTQFSSFFGGSGNRRPPPKGVNRMAQAMGLAGAASVLFGKTKYILAALKFTKLASLGSMVFTIGTYSIFFGWPYAVGMVGLIAVHEAGHALVLHHKGIPFSPAVFIPFMGAAIVTKELPRDAWEDALVGYGGPALGSVGAGMVALGAHATDSQLLFALADFGFMVNLFNLLPLGSLDGGRIVGAISPYASLVGVGMGGALAYSGAVANPIFYLVLLSGTYDTVMRLYDPSRLPPNYYNIPLQNRAAMTAGYFGLIVALVTAMDANQRYRKPPEVLMRERELMFDMR